MGSAGIRAKDWPRCSSSCSLWSIITWRSTSRSDKRQVAIAGSGGCLQHVHQPGIGFGDFRQRAVAARSRLDLELPALRRKRQQQELTACPEADNSSGGVMHIVVGTDLHLEEQRAAN